jgi:hypothetical protein
LVVQVLSVRESHEESKSKHRSEHVEAVSERTEECPKLASKEEPNELSSPQNRT